jgi:hypothetical protein
MISIVELRRKWETLLVQLIAARYHSSNQYYMHTQQAAETTITIRVVKSKDGEQTKQILGGSIPNRSLVDY